MRWAGAEGGAGSQSQEGRGCAAHNPARVCKKLLWWACVCMYTRVCVFNSGEDIFSDKCICVSIEKISTTKRNWHKGSFFVCVLGTRRGIEGMSSIFFF